MNKLKSPEKLSLDEKFIRWQTKAIQFIEKNELEKASKQLEGLCHLNYKPMTYEIPILNNLAQVYMKQKLYNKAMLILIKALIKAKQSSVQNYFGTLINLSSAASSLGIHTEAIIYLQKALKLIEGTADINLKVLCKYNIAIQSANIFQKVRVLGC